MSEQVTTNDQRDALLDLEDQIIRVKVMSGIARDFMQELPASTVNEQICHVVRATNELAEHLYDDFRVALEVPA